jgi:uncharacterized protein (DUF58 family)
MLPNELIRTVRRLEITTRRAVNDRLAGQYHSVFKGRGMAFDEVRLYQPGDDVRAIDWNVSARMNDAYVKVFTEERELTVMLLVDASASVAFGTRKKSKAEVAAELAALLAFSAVSNNDRVGLVLFTDDVEYFVPPKRGRKHVLRIVSQILAFRPKSRRTDIGAALTFLRRALHRRAIAFVISDFLQPAVGMQQPARRPSIPPAQPAAGVSRAVSTSPHPPEAPVPMLGSGYGMPLLLAARRHDVVPLIVSDPMEDALPKAGLIRVEDPETGETAYVDTGSSAVRASYAAAIRGLRLDRERLFARLGVDYVELSDEGDYVKPLVGFFHARARRMGA